MNGLFKSYGLEIKNLYFLPRGRDEATPSSAERCKGCIPSTQRTQAPREQVYKEGVVMMAVIMTDKSDWQGCQCTATTQEWWMDPGEKMTDI